MTMYALFKDKKQVSKAHSTKEAVFTEAYERGAMIRMPKIASHILANGFTVRPTVRTDPSPNAKERKDDADRE